jgi:hypothetical protein
MFVVEVLLEFLQVELAIAIFIKQFENIRHHSHLSLRAKLLLEKVIDSDFLKGVGLEREEVEQTALDKFVRELFLLVLFLVVVFINEVEREFFSDPIVLDGFRRCRSLVLIFGEELFDKGLR